MAEQKTELGMLIDCSEEDFRKYCEDKDLGYLSSFHNLMVQMFNEVQKLKDELVAKIARESRFRDKTIEEQNTLEGLYSKLLRIEQRVFILRELIKSRQIEAPKVPTSGT